MHAASRAKWFTLITLHCIFPGLTFLHDPSSALLLRPAADSLTHSGISPRLAAYRVSLLLNGRGEEGTSASCSPRSKVLGRSSASSLCRCQVFSRVTRSVLHRRDPREDVTTMSLRWLCHSREGGCRVMLISSTSRWRCLREDIRGRKILWQICNRRWRLIYFARDLFFLRGEKCTLISTLLTNEKRNANIRLFILVDVVGYLEVGEREIAKLVVRVIRNECIRFFSPARNIKISVLSPKHETSRYGEHDLFSPCDISKREWKRGHIPRVPPSGPRNPTTYRPFFDRSIDVMRISKGTLAGRGAARYLVIRGWNGEDGRELESNRADKKDTMRNPWRIPSMLSLPRSCLELKQTPLSEPIRDTPPFPYSPAAGATCRLFKLPQCLRSTVETF